MQNTEKVKKISLISPPINPSFLYKGSSRYQFVLQALNFYLCIYIHKEKHKKNGFTFVSFCLEFKNALVLWDT